MKFNLKTAIFTLFPLHSTSSQHVCHFFVHFSYFQSCCHRRFELISDGGLVSWILQYLINLGTIYCLSKTKFVLMSHTLVPMCQPTIGWHVAVSRKIITRYNISLPTTTSKICSARSNKPYSCTTFTWTYTFGYNLIILFYYIVNTY